MWLVSPPAGQRFLSIASISPDAGAGRGRYRAIAFHSEPALGEPPNPPLWTPAFAGVTVDVVPTNSKCDCPRGRYLTIDPRPPLMRKQPCHCHSERSEAESKNLKCPSEGEADLENSYPVFHYWS